MIIWAAFPSIDPKRAEETCGRWAERGFRTCVVMNREQYKLIKSDLAFKVDAYEGYYRTMNFLCQMLVENHRADIVVCIGDRVRPPDHASAHEIATTVAARFPSGVGVMQPATGALHVQEQENCPSPWICRNFIKRFYGGRGPFHEGYVQYFGGKELYGVAKRAGVLWPREDVHQVHVTPGDPDFYQQQNRESYFGRDAMTYAEREKKGFEGAEATRLTVIETPFLKKGEIIR